MDLGGLGWRGDWVLQSQGPNPHGPTPTLSERIWLAQQTQKTPRGQGQWDGSGFRSSEFPEPHMDHRQVGCGSRPQVLVFALPGPHPKIREILTDPWSLGQSWLGASS